MIGKNLFAGSRNRTFFGRYSYDYIYELELNKIAARWPAKAVA